MPPERNPSSSPRPAPVPSTPENVSSSEHLSTSASRARSPLQSSFAGTPVVRQIPLPGQLHNNASNSNSGTHTPLAGGEAGESSIGPGRSALAAALESNYGRSPPRFGTPPVRAMSPPVALEGGGGASISRIERNSSTPPQGPIQDPEIVKRHLVRPSTENLAGSSGGGGGSGVKSHPGDVDGAPDLDEFSSLQLKGGDVHRGVYRWAQDAEALGKGKRSKSFSGINPELENEESEAQTIRAPQGFRRDYLRRTAMSPAPSGRYGSIYDAENNANGQAQPQYVTTSFLEFLTLYGHFAGEDLEDDDDISDDVSQSAYPEDEDERGMSERSTLLDRRRPKLSRRKSAKAKSGKGNNTPTGAVLLLLKSFVGTGVLFLPKAFLNGGMLFSSLLLVGVAALCYHSFILLVKTRLKIDGSFGDMGGVLYGKTMRILILSSIVLSQIGFVAAYIVFTSENLRAFILSVSKCKTWIDIKYMVLMQLIIFLPQSLIRDITKLGFTALIADVFIMLGLVYLYYFDISTIVSNHGVSDIVNFNPSTWPLFVGTAIFTFEGVGLIIPIQESMKQPAKFPPVLALVMVAITILFTSIGAVSYAALGSKTKTVVLLNLPQDSKFVNGVQFLYSLAILLSTPLQLFPAIRILETAIFSRSGKHNPWVKWRKNVFRFVLVFLCAAIAWGGAADLDKFVSLIGSFACVPLVYIYPPLLHYRGAAQTKWQRVTDLALATFGLGLMGYTTVLTIRSWAGGASAPNEPDFCHDTNS